MVVLLFGFDAVCDEACYYKVAVSGKADCHNGQYCQDVCDYPEPEIGSAVYYLYQDGILIPKCKGIENWGFRLYTGHAIASFCVSDDLSCELAGWGEAYFDPNSLRCDSESSSATITVDLIFSETCCGFDIECGSFSVTITPICSCEDLMQNVGGSSCEDSEPNGVTCYCDDGLQDKADDKLDKATKPNDDKNPDPGTDPAEGGDPIILKTGALISSIADIHVPGRMMDINLVRTYKGDMNDPGFGHSYYGPWRDKIICIDDELKYYVTSSGVNGEGTVLETGEWGYQFLRISDVDYTFDEDVFDVYIPDPSDPNTPSEEYGKVYFKDYDGGSITIEYRYEIYAASSPSGITGYIIGLSGDTYSKTFDYNIDPGTGRLGRKWTHNYDISLERFDIEQDEDTTTQYLLYDGGGKKLLFTEPNSLIGWGSTPYYIDLLSRNGFICPPDKPHWDYKDVNGKWWKIYEDGSYTPKP